MPACRVDGRWRRRGRGAGLVAVLLALVAAGCGAPSRPVADAPVRSAVPAAVAAAWNWRLDRARSELSIRAFRAGPLAAFGHNHVILARGLEGRLAVPAADRYPGTRFELTLPVAALVVDDPGARRAAGAGFDTQPTADDVDGTREHLLGARLLDALAYPVIAVRGLVTADAACGLRADAVVVVKGREARVTVPLAVEATGDARVASGAFRVSHAELGLSPYTVAFGALAVADELEIRFRLVAVPAG